MKSIRTLTIALLVIMFTVHIPPAHAGLGDFFKSIKKAAGLTPDLSESRIIDGLKEALEIGTENAVKLVSRTDGYYRNPDIRIPLPDLVRKADQALRMVGFGPQIDALLLSMNRAAEEAAPEAEALFRDTIKKMSFEDARKILQGRDDEATRYFKEKTWDRLARAFMPIVHGAMSRVGVTHAYQQLDAKAKSMPFIGSLRFDLDEYVTDWALDGLFLMLAEEERKIRQDPAARVTDLLKDVFKQKN